jgi:hypothetical protein
LIGVCNGFVNFDDCCCARTLSGLLGSMCFVLPDDNGDVIVASDCKGVV